MDVTRNIFLIGPRACGKTTVGRALADRLGLEFVDTDHELVRSVGMEIADYVEEGGWEGFRDREAETLARVARESVKVIGCGGGIVLRPENREVLATGIVFYLKTGLEVLAERLMRDPNEAQRPSLTGRSIVDEIRDIMVERAPLYEGCADVVLPQGELGEMVDRALVELERLS
jgi:shikimate kinase